MKDYQLTELSIRHIVIGSGAAGFGAAARLHQLGERDLAIVTENISAGTSRNTGSDKQTYYKLSLAGADADSILNMAQDLFAGQCVDGDLALCEAALSAQCFYRLVELGVPFPCNEYGEFVGYKTDHDRGRRATSAGPYTSKVMTEKLETDVRSRGVEILDGLQAIRLLVQQEHIRAVLCLDLHQTHDTGTPCYQLLFCENCILATGGPAGIYQDSVYPQSQLGSSGLAFEAGIRGKNLTEWQYGMASLSPRWNVSGTYMQVLPRVVSTAEDGSDEREFLLDFFGDARHMQSMLFLKGYQWPFDVNKIFGGSSVIDLLVYRERCLLGRRVFLDYRTNSQGRDIDFSGLCREAFEYLHSAHACFGTPIQRLEHMNQPAVDFYKEHGVDLHAQMLEIAICAQHNNGGLATDSHWQTNVGGVYAVGELCGSHGVTRPGGTALNAGQVGASRAAEDIACRARRETPAPSPDFARLREQAQAFIESVTVCTGNRAPADVWRQAAQSMSRHAAMIRERSGLKETANLAGQALANWENLLAPPSPKQLGIYYRLRDMLISQYVYTSAMLDYTDLGAGSRGSALYTAPAGNLPTEGLPDSFRCQLDNGKHGNEVQEVQFSPTGEVRCIWREVRPIPQLDYFFENQWRAYRERNTP